MKRKPAMTTTTTTSSRPSDIRLYESAIEEILSDLKTTSMSSLHLPFTSTYVGQKRGSLTNRDQLRHKTGDHRSTKKLQASSVTYKSGDPKRRNQEQPRVQFSDSYLGFWFLVFCCCKNASSPVIWAQLETEVISVRNSANELLLSVLECKCWHEALWNRFAGPKLLNDGLFSLLLKCTAVCHL